MTIHGRRGTKAWFLMVGSFFFPIATIGLAHITFVQQKPLSPPISDLTWILLGVASLCGVYVFGLLASLRITVTETEIIEKSVWGSYNYKWMNVSGVEAFTTSSARG